jgi:hypothetical protein
MIGPLAEVVTLLQPVASFSKVVNGAGPWRVRRSEAGRPFFSVILDGSLRLPAGAIRAPHSNESGISKYCRRLCRTSKIFLWITLNTSHIFVAESALRSLIPSIYERLR